MTRSFRVLKHSLTTGSFRILDQALWSFGFFAFNLAAGISMSTRVFADFSIATAIGLIAVGVSRASAVDVSVVVGGRSSVDTLRSLHKWRSLRTALVLAGVAFVAVGCTTFASLDKFSVLVLSVVAFLMVFADIPRYFLIYARRFGQSLAISVTYAAVNGALIVAVALHLVSWHLLLLLWVMGALLTGLVGFLLLRLIESGNLPLGQDGYRLRLTLGAEALYAGIAGQVALFALYALGHYTDTAGVRLAYSLVLAPVFLLVQGLYPLFVLRTYRERGSTSGRLRTAVFWLSGMFVALVFVVTGAFIVGALGLAESILGPTEPFIIPLAFSLFAGQSVEVGVSLWRLTKSPTTMHHLRIVIVAVDVAGQIVGVGLGGAQGFVYAILLIAFGKTLFATWMLVSSVRSPA